MKRTAFGSGSAFVLACTLLLAALGGGCGSRGDRQVIQNKGSDTLVNVAQAWAEAYGILHPDSRVAVSGGGSGTGISAMINGTVDIANCSRKMTEEEIAAARANGHDPVEFVVGYDALAVFVHRDNPIQSLTLGQLAAIYGEGGEIETWNDLGVEIPGAKSDEIVLVSRQNNSGTYAYFREAVLGEKGEYKLDTLDMNGSKDLVDLVATTPGAIGYSGIAYATSEVKVVPIAKDAESPPIVPAVSTALDGSYPIARPLFMYTAGRPTGAIKDYMDWILSDEGQRVLLRKGYAPIRAVD
ncbi:MAG: PstS family phosphate ABC transporter substrate-binding protein [Planctomycetota bacterium]